MSYAASSIFGTAIARAMKRNSSEVIHNGVRVTKRGNIMLAQYAESRYLGMPYIVAYPKPEDKRLFEEANSAIHPYGPAEDFPGSIGSLMTECEEKRDTVVFIQSHYKIGREGSLEREIHNKYAGPRGWRYFAALSAIRRAHSNDREIVFPFRVLTRNRGLKSTLDTICEEHGYWMKKEGANFIVRQRTRFAIT
ncbi:MAG: hypothetical protein V1787_03390 [Candidatus Micrarchaeota archaeon]